jgi:hypothetical protein
MDKSYWVHIVNECKHQPPGNKHVKLTATEIHGMNEVNEANEANEVNEVNEVNKINKDSK